MTINETAGLTAAVAAPYTRGNCIPGHSALTARRKACSVSGERMSEDDLSPSERARAARRKRKEEYRASKEARETIHFCAEQTGTIFLPEDGDYAIKPPGQQPRISDGQSHGLVPHDDELQQGCDRFLRLLAEAPDIDPDAEPVKIDGEWIGGVRGKILQGLARGFWRNGS